MHFFVSSHLCWIVIYMYPVDGIFHPFNNEALEFNLNYDAQTCGKSHSCDFEMLTSLTLFLIFSALNRANNIITHQRILMQSLL